MTFEQQTKLYKVSQSTSKAQVWFAWTEGAEVICSYGELGGKLQENTYSAEPKNVGRANATTAEEQAKVELQAMYKHQMDNRHYKLTIEEAEEAAKVCREPRKITNYKDRYSKMSDELLTSVKLNGSRACVIDGVLYSKVGRPEEVKVDHIREAIEKMHENGCADFDSEVYAHGLSLQRIRSAWLKPVKTDKEIIKTAKDHAKKIGVDVKTIKTVEQSLELLGYNPNEDAPKLKLNVFDIPTDTQAGFEDRVYWMEHLERKVASLGLQYVVQFLYPEITTSHEERMRKLEEVYSAGYEGLVHYEPEGVYEFGKRSTNTAKSKPRLDSEALVTDVELCKNGEGKLVLQACDALGKVKFRAMMKGKHEDRLYEVQKDFIGQWVTFQYEELSEAGVPTKPTVMETRLCDEDGTPLE